MANYNEHVQKLKNKETVQFRPRGNSMNPKIVSGQLITVSPVDFDKLKKNEIVFCKVNGNYYVHLLTGIQGERFQISNNKGHVNGWIGKNALYGVVTKIED